MSEGIIDLKKNLEAGGVRASGQIQSPEKPENANFHLFFKQQLDHCFSPAVKFQM